LPIDLFGLHFPNPVGLAAGMDKLAEAVPSWEAMGFGFSELGGVTRHAQPGNPLPRIFRIIPDEALINRMGFNNPGADAFAHSLQTWRSSGHWPHHPVGVNLGKSKVTPLEEAAEDYAYSFRQLEGLADFVVVNVSSPNTPNLRQLQDRDALDALLACLTEVQSKSSRTCPILLKMAPDLDTPALDDLVEIALRRGVAGLVATNTTLARPQSPPPSSASLYAETGGLSGRPLAQRSTEVIRHLYRQSHGRLPIIGVGGIFSAADAWEKITAGASLVQVYSGLVYQGPGLPRAIVRGLRQRLHDAGFQRLDQAVGTANPLP
jgi:dihydroorotate dehydrogenase